VFLIPSVMEYSSLVSKSNKIFVMLHTPKSSLSKIHCCRAAFNCIRYLSFSGDKDIKCSVNEGFTLVKQYFILKVYQPITLSHEFQNYGVIRLL
jgi:hypothetical protein